MRYLVASLSVVFCATAFAQEEAPPAAAPSEPAPTEMPPNPEAAPEAPGEASAAQLPPQGEAVAPSAAPAPGQWVYTNQYGWLWMPHAQQYTYVPADQQVYPYQYVYYPVYGWRWVVAPWIYGWGPQPYWGAWGFRYYSWYAHPWFHVGGYWGWGGYHGWGQYRGWMGPRAWGARGWAGAPAYYRSGTGRVFVPAGSAHGGVQVGAGSHTAVPVHSGPAMRSTGAPVTHGPVANHFSPGPAARPVASSPHPQTRAAPAFHGGGGHGGGHHR